MRKIFYILIIAAVVGVGWWLASPLFINRTVSEAMPGAADLTPVSVERQGTFTGLAGHSGEGTARIVESDGKRYLRFEDDFKVTNGPDVFVYLGYDSQYAPETQLGALKGNIGSQNYEIPESIDLQKYDEAWIWCRAFGVPFAKAVLR